MPIKKLTWQLTWRNTRANDLIPLVLSTVIHTTLILVLAMCVSFDRVTSPSILQASFEAGEDGSLEDFQTTIFGAHLVESEELSAPLGPEGEVLSLDLLAMRETNLETPSLTKVSRPSLTRNTKAKNRPKQVHQIYASSNSPSLDQKSFRFGGKGSPGSRNIGLGPTSTLEVIVPGLDPLGSSVLSQANNLSLTGGAMMVSTAKPDPSLDNVALRFEYQASYTDGSRLVVNAGKQRVTLPLYDWELQPLAKFVDSGHHGAVSIHMFGNREKVSLDAAFEHTLLGLRFIQADMMPRGIIMSQEYLPQDEHGIILGPGELDRLSTDEEVALSVRELKPLMERARNGAPYSVLTDAKVPFTFSIEGNELVVSGSPYFFFWEPANKGNQVVPRKALNDALKKAWPQIKQANPLVIESMERSFRTVALFRFQKKNSPENWNEWMRQLSTVSLTQVPTPSMLSSSQARE